MNETRIEAQPSSPQIVITRTFAAPRALVFRAYTDPELLPRWLGPRELTLRVHRYDLHDGGRWRYSSEDADGNVYGFHGVFHGTPLAELQAGATAAAASQEQGASAWGG
jgi:uncharacterized protein YndB with AHSA1/START domain